MELPACPVSDTSPFVFVCEEQYWPLVHIVIPSLFYLYFRSFKLNLTLMFWWEIIEQLISLSGSQQIFVTGHEGSLPPESAADSIIGDGTMGMIGTLTMMGLCYYWQIPHFMPPVWYPGSARIYFKVFFQLLCFAAGTVAVAWEFEGGLISVGFYILMGDIPFFLVVFAVWNARDPKWYYKTEFNSKGRVEKYYTLPKDRARDLHNAWRLALCYIVFFSLFIVRWTTTWLQALCFGSIALGLIWLILLARQIEGVISNIKRKPYEMEDFFNKRM